MSLPEKKPSRKASVPASAPASEKRRSLQKSGEASGALRNAKVPQASSKRVDRRIVRRSVLMMMAFLVLAAVMIAALVQLQIVNHEYYREKVLDQMTYETEVNPERGTIYDRNGNILATNATVYLIFISPQDIIDTMAEREAAAVEAIARQKSLPENEKESVKIPQTEFTYTTEDGRTYNGLQMNELIARALSDILGVEYDGVIEKAAKNGRRYEVILKNVEEERADKVRAFISEYGFTRVRLTSLNSATLEKRLK